MGDHHFAQMGKIGKAVGGKWQDLVEGIGRRGHLAAVGHGGLGLEDLQLLEIGIVDDEGFTQGG